MAQIRLRNLTKRWGDFIAVDDFDLDIADEEFLVLLGPSGCGKTTTMRMIAGLEEITSGDVEIDGKVVNNLEPKDRDIAMVFQSYGLYPNMNVYENIRFPLKVRNVDPATHDERVRRAAAMVELDDFLHRRPAALSGGQRQQVAVGRALMTQPKVLMLDEPTAGVSPIVMDELFDRIIEVARTGIAILMVEQNAKQALHIADKGFVLVQGRNRYTDTGQALLADNDVRKAFLGG